VKVLVTGATGFTGSEVVPLLLERGTDVRCLVRRSSAIGSFPSDDVECVEGDLDDCSSIRAALRGVDALINIASLGFGHAPAIVAAALNERVSRCVFISTTAVFTSLNAPSKAVRVAAENAICNSGLEYTILRPTMIYGSSRDRNMCRLVRYLMRCSVIPIFGSGNFLQQPVYVKDLAAAAVGAAFSDPSIGKCYNISGRQPLTYNQVIDEVGSQIGRRIRKVHLPANLCVKVLQSTERLGIRLPIKSEQILRLNEHKAFPWDEAARDFGFNPRTFAEGLRLEIEELRSRSSPHRSAQKKRFYQLAKRGRGKRDG
jgi:uncharacterized protein YbjT (DUF2867 family)